jgi:murein DD-endopeptidase MepM/ murein hydrolase activator NlpD
LDIVKLNALGNRARGIAPADLEKYAIFGVPVYSPCEGTVVRAEDGHPDLAPPERDREHLAGNHVVIRTGDVKVLLAHLEKGSVAVKTGDEVVPGQEIGRVGNSGNTSQPHLHIHAERGGSPDSILDGQGVPMRFGDRFLVRNSLFTGTSR